MKKKIISLILLFSITFTLFAGCSSGSSGQNASPVQVEGLSERERISYEDTYEARLWQDSNLRSTVEKAGETDYDEDFNIAVNREWMLANSIPEGYSAYDTFSERQFELDDQIAELFANEEAGNKTAVGRVALFGEAVTEEEPEPEPEPVQEQVITDPSLEHDRELIRNFYELWLDWETRNRNGASQYRELLQPVMDIQTLDQMTEWLSRKRAATMTMTPITIYTGTDWNDAERYTVYIDSASLIFGDSMYYQYMTYDDWKSEPYYSEAAVYMVEKLGYSNKQAKEMVANCFAFEKDMSDYIMTTEQQGAGDSVKKQNNVYTMSELKALAGPFPVEECLRAYGSDRSESFILTEPKWLGRMSELYTQSNVEKMKAYIIVSTLMIWAEGMDRDAYVKINDVLNSIHGTEGMIPDEVAAAHATDEQLSMPLGHVYCAEYVSQETKDDVTAITMDIIESYKEMFMSETFVSDATREEAIKKLDNLAIRIAFPDKYEDYSDLIIKSKEEGGTLFEAYEAIADHIWAEQSSQIGTEIDDEIWTFSPQQVNACYDPTDNSITICGGILGGEFYSPDMTYEQMLGTIGAIIGHEISHSFDSSGRRFDENGNLRNWWTAWDAKVFDMRTKKLIAYYDSIMPFNGYYCSGTLVQTEAIADLTSMKCMLYIAKDHPGFDYRTLFESYATLWRMLSLTDTEYYYLTQDTHPLSYLRTNVVVQQYEEFYDVYDVDEGDGMYLAPEDRLVIW